MENSTRAMSKRARRRRQNEEKCDAAENEQSAGEQNKIAEKDSKNSRILVRRETFTVLKPINAFECDFSSDKDDKNEDVCAGWDSQNDSENSKNLTHTINVDSWKTETNNLTYEINKENIESQHDTYSINESGRPVPAPRRRQTISAKESDKNSSDTDKDVMEIEIDDGNVSKRTESSESTPKRKTFEVNTEEPPKPKPRKLSSVSAAFPRTESISRSKSLEEITVKVVSPRSTKSDPETKIKSPIVEEEVKIAAEQDGKRKRRFADLIRRRKEKKSSRKLPSVMRFDKARIPTISSILKDLREDSTKEKLEEENGIDVDVDSPRLPQSAPNDKMYVQSKNGFYLTNRDEFFKADEDFLNRNGEGERMEDSQTMKMLKTGIFFQKYWSRLMICVHGILAGLGFGHAFVVSAILCYYSEFDKFIDAYSCISLKIHFLFQALTSLSIISCLDRLDLGHLSASHWRKICCNFPAWLILFIYVTSFSLNSANQNTEFDFDARSHRNATEVEVSEDVITAFTYWYRIAWARDILVLSGWLVISVIEYPDNLYLYVKSLAAKSTGNVQKLRVIVS